jgi:hypothetical protein
MGKLHLTCTQPRQAAADGEPVEREAGEVLRAHRTQLNVHPAVNHRVHRLLAHVL